MRLPPCLWPVILVTSSCAGPVMQPARDSASPDSVPDANSVWLDSNLVRLDAGWTKSLTTYAWPAMTNERLLPDTDPAGLTPSTLVEVTATPGEYESASFVVRATEGEIKGLEVAATDFVLSDGNNVLPRSIVDLAVVKCWYQAGWESVQLDETNRMKDKQLVPELLLKDDALITVEGNENYLRLPSGKSVWISNPQAPPPPKQESQKGFVGYSNEELPIEDAASLQSFDLPADTNKQLWITVHLPDNASPGTYVGAIELRTKAGLLGQLLTRIRVLPFRLEPPNVSYSLYYRGKLTGKGRIGSEDKNEAQLSAELRDMAAHGISNPTIYARGDAKYGFETIERIMALRRSVGMSETDLFWLQFGGTVEGSDDEFKRRLGASGVKRIFLYGYDEQGIDEDLWQTGKTQRQLLEEIHQRGYQTYVAEWDPTLVPGVIPSLDVLVYGAGIDGAADALAQSHAKGGRVFLYFAPQAGVEKPEVYRRNYGLGLQQRGFDGAMDYAYQHGYGDIWNDFDTDGWRDLVFAYPTTTGVIGTVQWEGFREGVDDVRYYATLLKARDNAKDQGKDVTEVDAWLDELRTAVLSGKSLDQIRANLIMRILWLR